MYIVVTIKRIHPPSLFLFFMLLSYVKLIQVTFYHINLNINRNGEAKNTDM